MDSREKDDLFGVRSGAGGIGGFSSIKVRKPREKLFVDDRAVELAYRVLASEVR